MSSSGFACSDDRSRCSVSGEHDSRTFRTEGGFRAGIEDAIILPLVMAALAAKSLSRAALSLLIRILDYAFPVAMQLARLPLFTVRILGDGVIAGLKGIIICLPVAEKNREVWREFIGRRW